MSASENKKLMIIAAVDRGDITVREAASTLHRSERQVKRLLKDWRTDGAAGMAHGNRGRVPTNVLSSEVRQLIVQMVTTKWADANNQHIASMLSRQHHVSVSRMTVSRIRHELGILTPVRKRSPRAHHRRDRMSQFGVLLQIDGSPHDWFEGRAPACCLTAGIDDATSMVLGATFSEHETIFSYMQMLRPVVEVHGIPVAVYSDRHSIHTLIGDPGIEEQLEGLMAYPQFGRCLAALGISQIQAQTPEAKGRIERLFRTLQDRLVKELRYANISSADEANQFLTTFIPEFNAEFAVQPESPVSAFRPKPNLDLDYIFSVRETRTVQSDNTVSFKGQTYQVPTSHAQRSFAKAHVEVCQLPDGRMTFAHKKVFIAPPCAPELLVCPPRKPTPKPEQPVSGYVFTGRTPAPNHPWRRSTDGRRPAANNND